MRFINLQMFSDEENTPTETVENTDSEVIETTEEEKTSSKEEGTDVEFTDDSKTEEKVEKSTQSKDEKRANYERRIKEKHQKELEEAKRASYLEGVKKSTGGVNKFTNQPIEDEEDLAEYELMLEIDSKGDDPIEDYNKYVKEKNREAKRQAEIQAAEIEIANKKIVDDIDNFRSTYKDVDINELLSENSDFSKKFGKLVGKAPLSELYETYQSYQSEIDAKAENLALEKDARRESSTGGIGNNSVNEKSFQDMTPEEFHEFSIGIAKRY